jgi:hypothetical protein
MKMVKVIRKHPLFFRNIHPFLDLLPTHRAVIIEFRWRKRSYGTQQKTMFIQNTREGFAVNY